MAAHSLFAPVLGNLANGEDYQFVDKGYNGNMQIFLIFSDTF